MYRFDDYTLKIKMSNRDIKTIPFSASRPQPAVQHFVVSRSGSGSFCLGKQARAAVISPLFGERSIGSRKLIKINFIYIYKARDVYGYVVIALLDVM